jgi:hypothetical protein
VAFWNAWAARARGVAVAALSLAAAIYGATWIGHATADGNKLRPYLELATRLAGARHAAEQQLLARARTQPEVMQLVAQGHAAFRRLLVELAPLPAAGAVDDPVIVTRVELPPVGTLRDLDAFAHFTVHGRELAVDALVAQLRATFANTWQTRVTVHDEPGGTEPGALRVRVQVVAQDAQQQTLGQQALREALTAAGSTPASAEGIELAVPLRTDHVRLPCTAPQLLVDLGLRAAASPPLPPPAQLVSAATWERVGALPLDQVESSLVAPWVKVVQRAAWAWFPVALLLAALCVRLMQALRRRILAAPDRLPQTFALRANAPHGVASALVVATIVFALAPVTPLWVRVGGVLIAALPLLRLYPAYQALETAVGSRRFDMEGFTMTDPRPARGAARRSPRVVLWLWGFLLVACATPADVAKANKDLAEATSKAQGQANERIAALVQDVSALRDRIAALEKSTGDAVRELRTAQDAVVRNLGDTVRLWPAGLQQRVLSACTRALAARLAAEAPWAPSFPPGWDVLDAAFPRTELVQWEEASDEQALVWRVGLSLPLEMRDGKIAPRAQTCLLRVKRDGAQQGLVRLRWDAGGSAVELAAFAAGDAPVQLTCAVERLGAQALPPLRLRLTLQPGVDGNRLRATVAVVDDAGQMRPVAEGQLRAVD